ncbi:MAG TPA: hypothetical protein VF116_24050 [Ktedonobacterales bacterium]
MRHATRRLRGAFLVATLLSLMMAVFVSGTASAAPRKPVSHPHLLFVTWNDLSQLMHHSRTSPTVNPSNPVVCYIIHIHSDANGLDTAAELAFTGDEYGLLRARTNPAQDGGWERFRECQDQVTRIMTLQSLANNDYVSTELGGVGTEYARLRARATSVGPWEQYYVQQGFASNEINIISAANNLCVAAELGGVGNQYARLRARTPCNQTGPWEQFVFNVTS